MSTIWQDLQPEVVRTVGIVLPVAAGTLIAWLRARARTWATVKGAVRQAEEESASGAPLTGEEKHQLALRLLQQVKPNMRSGRASQLIEAVLPEVRRESEAPPPRTPRSG